MHSVDSFVFTIFLIFSGAALLSTAALFLRQSLLVAYMLLGVLLGPWGTHFVSSSLIIKQIGDIGIIFLLFLLGLHLNPQSLLHMLRKTIRVALFSSVVFFSIGFVIAILFNLGKSEAVIIGVTMMFSSTIIGLKLLPSTVLHHRHAGEIMISILLFQDLLAILSLLFIHFFGGNNLSFIRIGMIGAALPLMFIIAYLVERFVLIKLITKFDKIHEYVFLLSIGWCLGMAQLAGTLGLTEGIGAFIAGIAIAANPVSEYIADSLKPLRDFFLVMFFFYIGAEFNLHFLGKIIIPALILSSAVLMLKPFVYRWLLRQVSETKKLAWEIGLRLGQGSEFSLLIVYLALSHHLISDKASYLVQAVTIITFIVSSYVVILKYPTPMAVSDELRKE
jgi:Kef-type K+ transport system membrane component KefB